MVDFAALRTKMVDGQVRPSDVTDLRIIDAMLAIPREAFVARSAADLAYLDRDLPVSGMPGGRCMLAPRVLSKLIQAAGISSTDVVLDVACGTGYSSAVLAKLATSVVALDDDPALVEQATTVLANLGIDNVAAVAGPLAAGYSSEGPYDAILVNGAVEVLPETLFAQLKDGGRLVVVEGLGNAARGMVYTRTGKDVGGRTIMNASVPLLADFARSPDFVF